MELVISVEVRLGGRSLGAREVMRVCRDEYDVRIEDVGLSLAEGKDILQAIQQEFVTNQIVLVSAADKSCDQCGRDKRNKDLRSRMIQTVFGRVEARCYRYFQCRCLPRRGKYHWPLRSLVHDGATPEYRYLLSRWGSLLPYRQAASLLNEFLPLSAEGVSHVEVRRQTMKVGERLDSRATERDE